MKKIQKISHNARVTNLTALRISKLTQLLSKLEQFLLDLLKHNQDTEYGKQWKFSEIKNREDFAKNHPITNYDHYQEYMDKIANNGEKTILSNCTTPSFFCADP